MKLKVLLTYDDRIKQLAGESLGYHRRAIGIDSEAQSVISKHVYPEPGKSHIIAMYFPAKPYRIVCSIQTEDKDNLVAPNKKNLTKFGIELVSAGLEEEIRDVFDGSNRDKTVSQHLATYRFADLNFEYNDGKITFEDGVLKAIMPGKKNGMLTKVAF